MPRTLRWDPPRTPFTLANVAALGVTPRVITHAERSGRVVRLAHGVYINADALAAGPVDLHLQRAQAHQLLLPRALASHGTAALAWGLELDDSVAVASGPTRFIEPADLGTRARRTAGMLIHVRDLPPGHRQSHPSGLLVTTRDRAAVDVASEAALPEALITLDSAARMNLLELAGRSWIRNTAVIERHRAASLRPLVSAAQQACTPRTRLHVERVVGLADGRRESPAESLSFGHMVLAGLPLPEMQVRLTDQHGDMFPDFLWRKAGLIGEVDGEVKYDSRDVLVAERRREARLRALGWRIVRWEGAEIRQTPGQVMRRIAVNMGA